jgi:hypothetical protein
MIARFLLAGALMLAAAACQQLPRDPDGTLDRVRSGRSFRVGMIASGDHRDGQGLEQAFIRRVAAATGARPLVTEGAAEPLLLDLEEGGLDLVMGMVSPKSPWVNEVAILQPLGQTLDQPRLLLVPIARNGENEWIMLLEREARAVRADGAGDVR